MRAIKYTCVVCGVEKEQFRQGRLGGYHLRRYCERCRALQPRAVRAGTDAKTVLETFRKQDGKCALCDTELILLGWGCCIDHDHVTGKFRGLLCCSCNTTPKKQYENVEWFSRAIKYLGIL